MTGCSKGGQAVLMEAQRFPEDFDGLVAAAPVYDFVGRILAATWWVQAWRTAPTEGRESTDESETVQTSVLALRCARRELYEGVVTNPARVRLDAGDGRVPDRRLGRQVALRRSEVQAVKRMMSRVVNSRGEMRLRLSRYPGHGH